MGKPTVPSESDIKEALSLAREHLDAVDNDDESWLDRLIGSGYGMQDTSARYSLYVMINELVRTHPIVEAARAELVNKTCSNRLRNAVGDYDDTE